MRRSSIACSRRRTTAFAGDVTGSISCGSPKRTATNSTTRFRKRGAIAIISSARLTTIFPTTSSSRSTSPATCSAASPQSARPHERVDRGDRFLVVRAGQTFARRFAGRGVRSLDNQIDVMGKAFLGLSIACARCHDHKFDAIRARDYYALTGFLRSSRQQFAFLADPRPVARALPIGDSRTNPAASSSSPGFSIRGAGATVRRMTKFCVPGGS